MAVAKCHSNGRPTLNCRPRPQQWAQVWIAGVPHPCTVKTCRAGFKKQCQNALQGPPWSLMACTSGGIWLPARSWPCRPCQWVAHDIVPWPLSPLACKHDIMPCGGCAPVCLQARRISCHRTQGKDWHHGRPG